LKPREDIQQIPGILELAGRATIPKSVLLLAGPPGAGKTMYCRQFIADGLFAGDHCICVNSDMSERRFTSMLSGVPMENLEFIELHSYCRKVALSSALSQIQSAVKGLDGAPLRVVADSLTHMSVLCGERQVLKFARDLSLLLREAGAVAIFTLTTYRRRVDGELGSLVDGVLEMKLDDRDALCRSARLRSVRGLRHNPAWVSFTITETGDIAFDQTLRAKTVLNCVMCGKAINGAPLMDFDLAFDSKMCMETYKKLAGIYGQAISDAGLPSEVLNVSFFFTDIVGLSDPSLSVEKQIQKIQVLNGTIASCDAFLAAPKEKKIVLPTGDGVAIGFLNPELPLELAVQLHRKLRTYNAKSLPEDRVNVRIGLGSGPIFIVADINSNQNIWGPGIIVARRVMDAGDSGHILIAGTLAEELMALKDGYRQIIRPVCDYQIKHGQTIKLYSAHSYDFGNPKMPARAAEAH
jgi:KaiC/GvpD/RAD55 family RecA-like ATPase/class 3 adenylate cyclase